MPAASNRSRCTPRPVIRWAKARAFARPWASNSPRCATVSCTTRPPRRTERTRRQYVCALRPFRRTACRRYTPPPPAARSLTRRPARQQGGAVGTTSCFGNSPTKSRSATGPALGELFLLVPNCGSQARPPLRPAPAAGAGSGGAGEVPFVAHLRHAAEHEATKGHRLLALGVPAKDARHARGAE